MRSSPDEDLEAFGGKSDERFACRRGRPRSREYALIIAVIAIAVIVALLFLRDQITNVFSNIGNNLT